MPEAESGSRSEIARIVSVDSNSIEFSIGSGQFGNLSTAVRFANCVGDDAIPGWLLELIKIRIAELVEL
jgi:hypothetical protein